MRDRRAKIVCDERLNTRTEHAMPHGPKPLSAFVQKFLLTAVNINKAPTRHHHDKGPTRRTEGTIYLVFNIFVYHLSTSSQIFRIFGEPLVKALVSGERAVETHWYSENPAPTMGCCNAVVNTVDPASCTFLSLCDLEGTTP